MSQYNEHPGDWLSFLKRDDNNKLNILEAKSKYYKEQLLYENFVSSIIQQQQVLANRNQFAGGVEEVCGLIYTFGDRTELDIGIDLWINDKPTALTTYGEINCWDVSNVTDMSRLFINRNTFDDDISNWEVSQVTTMQLMFYDANLFNQNLNGWNTGNVGNMTSMFNRATIFNLHISSWDVSSVTSTRRAFNQAVKFNQDLSAWDVSSVTNMEEMFRFALEFDNGGVALDWSVGTGTSLVSDMEWMFGGATAFNQDVSSWDVSSVNTMKDMFSEATSFDKPLSNWERVGSTVSNVTTMYRMFGAAIATTSVFNQDISNWNVTNVTDMGRMFESATTFNQDLSTWSVDNVTFCSNVATGATAWVLDKPNFTSCTP